MRRSRTWLAIGCVALMVASANCGRSSAGPAKAAATKAGNTSAEASAVEAPELQAGAGAQEYSARIEAVEFSPLNPNIDSTIKVAARTAPAELPEDLRLEYIYWVNAAIALQSSENTFSLSGCKKNDLLYVDAVLFAGEREILRKRSKMVKIVNRLPTIRNVDFPQKIDAGIYRIKVSAFDPDGDTLTYTIEGEELPKGSKIDANGVIDIPVPPPADARDIAFWVVIGDNSGEKLRQKIKIAFGKTAREKL